MTLTVITLSFINLPDPVRWWQLGIGILILILLFILYRSSVKPVEVARLGLDLLGAQDFNNRLVKVGEPGADKIVDLFNGLITRLKNERLRMKEQNKFLNLLIDASPMGIVLLNLGNKISVVNPAFRRIAEIPADRELIGSVLADIDNPVIETLLKLAPGSSATIRFDGSRLYRGYHLWFMQDGFQRHFYMIESLTEEVRIAEKEAYGKVIRMISHEVNNTMGSVQSVLEILSEEMADDTEMFNTLESCRERCTQMCSFIDAFSDLAKIPEPVMTEINLDEELMKLIPFFRLMMPEGTSITFNPEQNQSDIEKKDQKIISADASLLQQVLVNIVKNAVESLHPDNASDGYIRFETLKDKSGVTLIITNNGESIGDDVANSLFTPFFSTKRQGRGLGLTLVADVLRKHGCTFSLRTHSDNLTRFQIRFPAHHLCC